MCLVILFYRPYQAVSHQLNYLPIRICVRSARHHKVSAIRCVRFARIDIELGDDRLIVRICIATANLLYRFCSVETINRKPVKLPFCSITMDNYWQSSFVGTLKSQTRSCFVWFEWPAKICISVGWFRWKKQDFLIELKIFC